MRGLDPRCRLIAVTSPVLRIPHTLVRYTDESRIDTLLQAYDREGLDALVTRLGVNVRVSGGKTILMLAAERDHLLATTSLLCRHADVAAVDDSGKTALHYAAMSGADGVAEVLIDAGAPVDMRDAEGRTPLWYAAARNYPDSAIVDVFLRAGANPRLRDHHGVNANDML